MDDVIIIGAGPAGLMAAITCASHGLKVSVLDEFMYSGGRLLGQLYQESKKNWWNGIEESKKLTEKAYSAGVKIQLNTSVIHIEKNGKIWEVHTEQSILQTPNLLLATGATEAPFPIPGWTLPGVMSIGAAQVMTNVHRVKPGSKGIIIGIDILSIAIALELQMAGVKIYSLTMPQKNALTSNIAKPIETFNSLVPAMHLAPNILIRTTGKFFKSKFARKLSLTFYPKNGISLSGIPVQLKKAVTEIYGKDSVEGVNLVNIKSDGDPIPGSDHSVEVDFVCISGGLSPLVELAALAGCSFTYIDELGGYVPLHNEKMETNIDGLFVAGNITGIEGAKVAMAQGETAGYSILSRMGFRVENELIESIRLITETRKKALIQFHPNIDNGRERIIAEWQSQLP